jgi:hypothetical protein
MPSDESGHQHESTRPRRRWLRYSLRTLLVFITVFGVWLGIKVDQARRQKRAVEQLLASGVQVGYKHQYVNGSFDPSIELNVPKWAQGLCGEDFFQTVTGVGFAPRDIAPLGNPEEQTAHKVTSADLACLADLPRLERLGFYNVNFDEDASEFLRAIKSLKGASFVRTNVGDELLRQLSHSRRLEWLDVSGPRVSDDGLVALSGLSTLKRLGLDHTATGDRGLAAFKACRQLSDLSVGSQTTDAGLQQFESLDSLESLYAVDAAITGRAFRSFRLPKLDRLVLDHCAVDDDGLSDLVQALVKARHVNLRRCKISDAGLRHFASLRTAQELILSHNPIRGRELRHLSQVAGITQLLLNRCPLDDPDLESLEPLFSGAAPGAVLSLNNTNLGDRDLAKMNGFTNLQHLNLAWTDITDDGLPHLYKLQKLAVLSLQQTNVTAVGVKKLQQAIPGAVIKWGNDVTPEQFVQ